LKILQGFRVTPHTADDSHILREKFRKPESNIGFLASLEIDKFVNPFNDYHNFLVDLLSAVDNLLFLNLGAADVQPICEVFTDFLL
jgi:hypothetical protein